MVHDAAAETRRTWELTDRRFHVHRLDGLSVPSCSTLAVSTVELLFSTSILAIARRVAAMVRFGLTLISISVHI